MNSMLVSLKSEDNLKSNTEDTRHSKQIPQVASENQAFNHQVIFGLVIWREDAESKG